MEIYTDIFSTALYSRSAILVLGGDISRDLLNSASFKVGHLSLWVQIYQEIFSTALQSRLNILVLASDISRYLFDYDLFRVDHLGSV